MYGLPNTLQTRTDYDRALDMARTGTVPGAAVARHFAGLLASRFAYEFDRTLTEHEEPSGGAPEYLVIPGSDETPRRQLIRREQPSARINALGYSVAEVEQIVAELESL